MQEESDFDYAGLHSITYSSYKYNKKRCSGKYYMSNIVSRSRIVPVDSSIALQKSKNEFVYLKRFTT